MELTPPSLLFDDKEEADDIAGPDREEVGQTTVVHLLILPRPVRLVVIHSVKQKFPLHPALQHDK